MARIPENERAVSCWRQEVILFIRGGRNHLCVTARSTSSHSVQTSLPYFPVRCLSLLNTTLNQWILWMRQRTVRVWWGEGGEVILREPALCLGLGRGWAGTVYRISKRAILDFCSMSVGTCIVSSSVSKPNHVWSESSAWLQQWRWNRRRTIWVTSTCPFPRTPATGPTGEYRSDF